MVCPSVLMVVVFFWPTDRSELVDTVATDLCLVSDRVLLITRVSTDDSTSAQTRAASVRAVQKPLCEACARAVRLA
jgi:hypothetical protein